MKKMVCLLSLLFFISAVNAQSAQISVIPEPVSVKPVNNEFHLHTGSSISVPSGNDAAKKVGEYLADFLRVPTGFPLIIREGIMTMNTGNIALQLNKDPDSRLGEEGYRLMVNDAGATIQANQPAGLFYGVQTFLQLLPKEIESKSIAKDFDWKAPGVEIMDYPRFAWRGLMFDVSRHFFTKQEVKEFIDDMVRYKFNLLHMHLTDDEGWRIEIKSYPRLTSVGAWNVKKVGTFGNFTPPKPDEPRNYGGFYTQDDIREIVQYAKDRFVNILPEVDVPGHSLAAIASYPELSCTPGADQYKVRSGEKIMNWAAGGFTALVDNTLCPANEKVYTFLDKVFTELAQLFPFGYIHMGGDECAKNFWEKSDQIKQLMKKENLKDMHEVQSYFVKRVEKIVESKGKKLIGWDEILEGGLAPNAAVMSWRGMKGGITAAKMGHEVVMSPTTFVYLDYMQGDRAIEPPVYSTLRLSKTYSFEPVPEGVDPKLIKGGQGNLWTEQIYNYRHLQYMLWPRTFALSEVLWTPKDSKNWKNFVGRVEDQFGRYDEANKKYAPSMYDPIIKATKSGTDGVKVEFENEIDDLDVYFSFDNSFPDRFYPKYTAPVEVPEDASNLRVITYRGDKKMGRDITISVSELRKRAGYKNSM